MENEFSNRISVKNIVLAGMFAAFLAVMSQVSPLDGSAGVAFALVF